MQIEHIYIQNNCVSWSHVAEYARHLDFHTEFAYKMHDKKQSISAALDYGIVTSIKSWEPINLGNRISESANLQSHAICTQILLCAVSLAILPPLLHCVHFLPATAPDSNIMVCSS